MCGEDQLLDKLGIILFEYLGEEYPEVLGSILSALKVCVSLDQYLLSFHSRYSYLTTHHVRLQSIVNVVGMAKMQPSIKDLLPRLTPVLKNRHEKVQENCIDLVGRIAGASCRVLPACHPLSLDLSSSLS